MSRSIPALLLCLATQAATAQAPERHVLSGDRVAIWNLAGRAEVVAGSGREVVVELTRGGRDGRRLTVEAADGRLVVRYPSRDIAYRAEGRGRYEAMVEVADDGSFSGGWDDGRSRRRVRIGTNGDFEGHADLRIMVPEGQLVALTIGVGAVDVRNVKGALELRTMASPIRASGTSGRFSARTGSGRVELDDVAGERVQASTGSGSVDLVNVRTPDLRVSTGSGSIEGRDIGADRAELSTGSGSIGLVLSSTPRDFSARTGSGSVTLTLGREPNVELDIRTGSGGVTTDLPVTMDEVRRNELRGRIGSGADGRIRVSTGSGSVRIRRP